MCSHCNHQNKEKVFCLKTVFIFLTRHSFWSTLYYVFLPKMTILKIFSTRLLWNTVLTLKCFFKRTVPSGNTNTFAFHIFGLNVCVHPWFHSAGEIWARRNRSGWNIHSGGNIYIELWSSCVWYMLMKIVKRHWHIQTDLQYIQTKKLREAAKKFLS